MLLKCHNVKGEYAQKSTSFSKIMTSSAAFFEISLLKVCWFVCLFNSGSQGV